MSLGKCSCCGSSASVNYPLLPGSPSFCSSHHNERDAGKFGCDFSPPDWMDSADFGGDEYEEEFEPVEERLWTTKDKRTLSIKEMSDAHVINSFNYVLRQLRESGADPSRLESLGTLAYEIERRKLNREKR